jgi:DNA-binding transcriptional LysR family regulator
MDVLAGMRVFTAVIDSGSFASAADRLDLSRAMTSRHVAQLEARLGVRLMNRTTRRLSLTEAGRDYYMRATQILALAEEAENAAASGSAAPTGVLRVSTSVAFGSGQLAPAVRGYLQRYPEVRIELTVNDRVVDLVEEGFDLAVRIARRLDPGVVARPIGTAGLVACASPKYLQLRGMPRSPDDLAHHDCLTYAYTTPRLWRFTRHGKTREIKVSGPLHSNNGGVLAAAAADGNGICLEPSFIVDELLRSRKLVRLLPAWETDLLTVYAVYPTRTLLAAKVRTFVDYLVEYFQESARWGEGATSRTTVLPRTRAAKGRKR